MSDTATEATPTPEGEDQSQTTQAPPEGTSAAQTTEPFTDGFDVNTLDEPLRDRYRQMEAGLTKRFQEAADQRKQAESAIALERDLRDPETRPDALKWLAENGMLTEDQVAELYGWDISPEEGDEEEGDPLAKRLAELEGKLTAREQAELQARQQAEQEAHIAKTDEQMGKAIQTIEQELGHGLSEKAQRALVSNALVLYPDGGPDGTPDVQAAYKDFMDVVNEFMGHWAAGKETAQPTRPGGESAVEVPDTDTHEGRVAQMMARLAPGGPGA